jgi:CBS domain-containing protein
MIPHICYCQEENDLGGVARVMEEKQIRRIPVLNSNKRLVGIVSLGDFAIRSNTGA